jgi:hypothetical protein
MFGRPFVLWLPRLLWRLTLVVSALLALLVVAAPWFDTGERALLTLFAKDQAVRRTTLASALGLLVTAAIFFRPVDYLAAAKRTRHPKQLPPPPAGAGA